MHNILNKVTKSDLLKASGAYTFATFVLKGVNFFTIPLFTHMMSVSQYGVVNNFVAWVSIFSIFVGLNLNASINNAYHEMKDDLNGYLSAILTLSFLVFVVILLGTLGLDSALPKSISLIFLVFVVLQSYVSFVISFQSTYLMIRNKYLQNIVISFLSTALNVGFSVLFMVSLFKAEPDWGRIVGSTVGLAFLAVPIFLTILIKGKNFFDKKYWLYALKISVPLIPHAVGNFVISQFDRIMIQAYNGNNAVGLYSFVYNIATIISVLWTASNNAWVPWFFKKFYEESWQLIRKTANLFVGAFMVLTIMLMPLSVEVSKFLGSADYQAGIALIMPVTLGYFFQFMYGFPVNTEFALKKTSFIGISTGIAAIFNVVLNLIFLPRFGYMSAGYTTLVTYLLLFIVHYVMANKLSKRHVFDGVWFTLASIIMVAYTALQIAFIDSMVVRYGLMLVFILIVMIFVYRNYKTE